MKRYVDIGQGRRIKEIRGSVSQPAFAARLGVSLQGYLNYEYGKRVPPDPVLAKLSEMSGRSVEWILTGVEPGTVPADRAAETPAPYGLDDVTQKVVQMMARMSEGDKREVLKYASYRKHEAKKKLKEGA
jgi:transcriptional regulator with XRE-family HTH domain